MTGNFQEWKDTNPQNEEAHSIPNGTNKINPKLNTLYLQTEKMRS